MTEKLPQDPERRRHDRLIDEKLLSFERFGEAATRRVVFRYRRIDQFRQHVVRPAQRCAAFALGRPA